MPLPIRKVQDESSVDERLKIEGDWTTLLPMLRSPLMVLQFPTNEQEKTALKNLWLHSHTEGDILKVADNVSEQDLALLRSKGLITTEEQDVQLTDFGKKTLKAAILDDERSSFTKKASKQLLSKNSYDFGADVLVRLKHPDKFGTKYITISKKSFAKKDILPIDIKQYSIATKKEDGSYKTLHDYSDDELIHVLHLAKRVVGESSKIALAGPACYVPVNRIKAFAEMIMGELNATHRRG
jgi:hypothetical protein